MRRIPLLLLTIAMSACNFAPRYRTPAAPIAVTYPIASDTEQSSINTPLASQLAWHQYFTDERLQTLIGLALARNRDLEQSVARIAQARARYGITNAQRLPAPELSADATRSRQPLSTLGGSEALPGSDPGGPNAIELTQHTVNIGSSNFELDLWGRLQNLAAAERARYLASVEGARSVRLTLIAEVARTYFDIRAGERRIDLAEQSIIGRREGVRVARVRLDAGVTSTIDNDQTMLLLTQAMAELAEVKRVTEQSRNLLEVLVGGPITEPLPPGKALTAMQQLHPIEPGLPSDLLTERPDVAQAEYNLKAANANIGALRAQFFPTLSLTAAYGYASPVLADLLQRDSTAWNVGATASIPIFDWGRRRAQLDEGKAQAAELIAAYQRTVQGAFREVADALAARRRYAEQIEAQTHAVAVQRSIAQAAHLRYDNGISIYLQVLDAERGLFSAEQQLAQLQALELQSAVDLYIALGGDATTG